MEINDLEFGRIIARLPTKTLVRQTYPPYTYFLVKGGFLDSKVPTDSKIIRFLKSEAEDGTCMAYIDKTELSKEIDKANV